jgi:hypothetical protein
MNPYMTFSTTPEPIERLDSASSEILDSLEKLRLEPAWIAERRSEWGEKVMVPEWEEDSGYRAKNGFLVRTNGIDVACLRKVFNELSHQCLLTGPRFGSR